MSDFKVIDKTKEAKWYVNRGLFPLPDGSRHGVRFEPGVPTKVEPNAWMKGQPLLVECPDPMSADAEEAMPKQIEPETVLRTPGKSKKG